METNTPTTTLSDDSSGAPLLAWSAATVNNHERSKRWYVIAGSIMGSLVIGSIWLGNWSFAIVLLLLSAVYTVVHRKEPTHRNIEFWQTGVQFCGKYEAWNRYTGYWMLQGKDYVELHIARAAGAPREVMIQLGSVQPDRVRQVLNLFLPELSHKVEHPIDTLIRILKI